MSTAGLASLLPLPVAIPLAGATLAPIAARVSSRLALTTSMIALTASAAILLAMAPTVYGGNVLVHFMGHWGPVGGKVLGDALATDPLGLDFALFAAIIGAVTLLFTLSSLGDLGKRELGNFACLFLLLDAALIGSALTADLLNLFVWFEVAALASYALTAFFLEEPLALEAAFKVLALTNLASFFVFVGTALIYVRTGALDFAQIYHAIHGHPQTADTIALGLLAAGFLTKAGIIPFHGWLPDAHHIPALHPGRGKAAARRANGLRPSLRCRRRLLPPWSKDLKRLLAYDTISQMGVLLVGLATGRAAGLTGTAYHLIDHALFKSLLFLCAGAIVHATGASKLSEMGGLVDRMPGIAIAFAVGAVAIAGLPPLNGYAGVGLIHDALLDQHQYLPLAIMLLAQVLTIAALGKATWRAFYRPARGDYERDERLRPGMFIALVALGGACLASGVLPSVLLPRLAVPAAAGVLAPAAYSRDILAGGGSLPHLRVNFRYFDVRELLTVAATAAAAFPVGRLVLSKWLRATVARIRSIQTGSVNDYASYLVTGLIITVVSLEVGR